MFENLEREILVGLPALFCTLELYFERPIISSLDCSFA